MNSSKALLSINLCKNMSVKQFLFLLVFIGFSINAQAQKSCIEFFSDWSKIDTKHHEKNYTQFKNNSEHSKNIQKLPKTDYYKHMVEKYGKLSTERFHETDRLMDVGLMGTLGQLFDLKLNTITKKVEAIHDPIGFDQIQSFASEIQKKPLINPKNYSLLRKLLKIEELDKNTVQLQITSLSGESTELQSALRHYFQVLYGEIATFTYRKSGLVENKEINSYLLNDDILVYAANKQYLDYTLVYDKKVWTEQMKLLNDIMSQYSNATTAESKRIVLNQLYQARTPFLPMAGMAQAKSYLSNWPQSYFESFGLKKPSYPIELKRYFANEFEDPLNLVPTKSTKNEFLIRHKMILRTIEQFPEGQKLEIHSHTPLHTRAYAKLGFIDQGVIKAEKFSDGYLHLLTATREAVIEKIRSILDMNQ